MGRGLAAILTVPDRVGREELRTLAVEEIEPNPDQPRRRFDQGTLAALAESVEERGILQPVLVRPRTAGGYELIAGERRWRAAKLAGLETLPAIVRPHDDAASLELALIENMAREDLNPVEEARAVAALVEELGLSREQVGKRVGRSRVAISNLLRILDLPDEALELLEAGRLTEGHGRALLMAPGHDDRRRLARAAVEHGWSVRVTEDKARAVASPRQGNPTGREAVHPDQAHAAEEIAAALGAALGTDVKVRTAGTGFKVELAFASADEAVALARRLRPRAVA
jgi:ParB family chromosome partitioning protein